MSARGIVRVRTAFGLLDIGGIAKMVASMRKYRVVRSVVGYVVSLVFAVMLILAYVIYTTGYDTFVARSPMSAVDIFVFILLLGAIVSAAPSALFIVIAKWKRFRSVGYYLLAGTIIGGIASVLFLVWLGASSGVGELLLVGIAAGTVSGAIYWAIAGRVEQDISERRRN